MKEPQILFVEDDPYLGLMVNDLFESKGFSVRDEKSGESALKTFIKDTPDLCVLDVMLPGMNGFELGRRIREINPDVPIIFLTARTQKDDVVEGYASGADDYLRKPFHMEELILRVQVLLKRSNDNVLTESENQVIEFQGYQFNFNLFTLESSSDTLRLTPKEAGILKILCAHPGELIARDYILKEVWGDDNYFSIKSMDVFMHKLRGRFRQDPSITIVNVRGRGFKLVYSIAGKK